MSFQRSIRTATRTVSLLAAALAFGACLPAFSEKPPVPTFRVPLQDLGFPGYAPALLRAGTYSMATVHLLDSTHLLFTYSLRALVPRIPGDDENDSDRLVAAEVVELPTGKVLTRTQWRLHDHGRYLWRGGQGIFVLRSADELSTFAPLRGLASGTSFQRIALPHPPGVPQFITSSPDDAVLTIETQRPEDATPDNTDGDAPKATHTIIEFLRVFAPAHADEPIKLNAAGPLVGSTSFLRFALDGDGYLWAEDKNRGNWLVTFNEYGGKQQKLATIHSSCRPRLSLLSRGEFLVEGCRGTDDSPVLATYGFDGHENWEEPTGENLQSPTLVTAPVAGRFAMSRLIANGGSSAVAGLVPDNPLAQEIRVYQTESGNMLLHLQCAEPVRTAENFDLSPDGSTLAVLGHQAIEIYKLPPLSDQDRKELAEVKAMTPPLSQGPVVLANLVAPVGSERRLLKIGETEAPGTNATAAEVPKTNAAGNPSGAATGSGGAGASATPQASAAPTAQQAAGDQNAGTAVAGDVVATPRKPPTLLAPGESPEYKGSGGTPK